MYSVFTRLKSSPKFNGFEMAMAVRSVGSRLGWASLLAATSASHAFAAGTGAGTGTDPGTFLLAIVTFLTGAFGQSLAVLGIIAIGLAWMFGRASLGLVAGVVGGIVIMFGASYMVGQVITTTGG